uniref:hypothetical protein n=1 Tax=Alistipes sp. TaxID=1872444 RepID=UPI004057553A
MRIAKFTLPGGNFRAVYPNGYAFSRSPYSHVVVYGIGGYDGSVTLVVGGSAKATRVMRPNGAETLTTAVFPLTELLEEALGDRDVAKIEVGVYTDSEYIETLEPITVFKGVSRMEIDTVEPVDHNEYITPSYPIGRVPIYNNMPEMINEILFPTYQENGGEYSRQLKSEYGGGTQELTTNAPTIPINGWTGFSLREGEMNMVAEIGYNYGRRTNLLNIPVYYDSCTEGIFVSWINSVGLKRTMRWDVEVITDSYEDAQSAVLVEDLGSKYDRYSKDEKIHTKKYTLHSGMLPRDMAETAKSLLFGRDIQYRDPDTKQWYRCRVAAADVEDNLDPMQDIIVELIVKQEVAPW